MGYTRRGKVLLILGKLMETSDTRYGSHIRMVYNNEGQSNIYVIEFYSGLFIELDLVIVFIQVYVLDLVLHLLNILFSEL